MESKKKRNLKPVIIWAVVILLAPVVFKFLTGGIGRHDVEDISKKIEEHLYEKYGEEFVVDRIGLRNSRGQDFYQARIYPESIIGTNKEWDDYYYASASVNKYSFGRLGGVGDSYSYVYRNIDVEEYLLPEAKKIFGERILLKVDVAHKVTGDGSWWAGYKSCSLEEMRKDMKEEPDRTRIELDLQVYIFDRIENEKEKEVRRKEIFDFVQYLKEEGLFEYLELGVIFIDERVLAPGYSDFRREIARSSKVREKIDGEEVYLPPKSLRKKMSRELQEELDEMSEEELLASMRGIRKSDLSYDVLDKYNATHYGLIYSVGILEVKYKSSYKKYKENKTIDYYYYKNISDIKIGKNLEYAYIN